MGAFRMPAANLVEMPVGERRGFDVERAVRATALGSVHAKAVLMVLASAVNAEGWCFVGSDRVEREADVEGETLRKVRRIFEAMGLVKHTRLTKLEMLELRRAGGDGAFREEEWQLNLGLLGSDLREEYERWRVRFGGKATKPADAARGKAKPGPKVVAADIVAATGDVVAADKKMVAATNPPNPLLGRTTIEPSGTTTAREVSPAKALDAGSAMVAAKLSSGTARVHVQRAVRDAMEAHCLETGQRPAAVAGIMQANHAAAVAMPGGLRFGLVRWFDEGHWKHAPVSAAGRVERLLEPGIYRGGPIVDEPLRLSEVNDLRRWKSLPPLASLEGVGDILAP